MGWGWGRDRSVEMVSGGREKSVEGAYVVKIRMISLLASHRVSLLSTLLLVAVLQFTYSLVHNCRCISEVRRSGISDVAATFL
jgi:hypothetical protein